MSRTKRNKLRVYISKYGTPKLKYKCKCKWCLEGRLHKHYKRIEMIRYGFIEAKINRGYKDMQARISDK